VVRVGGSARRSGLPLQKWIPRIPDPGRHVDLRTEDGAWRKGFRALSEPWTAATGEVMIWVTTEYGAAGREGRSAVHGTYAPDFPSPPLEPFSQVSERWATGQVHIRR
jgi:hypothetical protein